MYRNPSGQPSPNLPPPVYRVEFDEIDLDNDGNLTKEEFAQVPQSPTTDSKTPIIWFVILIVLIGIMVFLTKFLREKEK